MHYRVMRAKEGDSYRYFYIQCEMPNGGNPSDIPASHESLDASTLSDVGKEEFIRWAFLMLRQALQLPILEERDGQLHEVEDWYKEEAGHSLGGKND